MILHYTARMKLFSWFSRKEVLQFAAELAAKFASAYPLEVDQDLSKGKREKQLKKTLSKVKKELILYRQNNRLSIYQKALLGKAFQNELFKRGYSAEFVEEATEEIVLLIS